MRIKFELVHIILFIACFFVISLPFYVWNSSWIRHLSELICISIFLNHSLKHSILSIRHRNILVLFLLLVFYINIRNFNPISVILNTLLCSVFFIQNSKVLQYYESYKTFISIFLLISLVVYFAVLWLNIDLPYNSIQTLNSVKPDDYRAYPFLAVYDSDYGFVRYRFCGPYDEPGVIGTMVSIILYGERYNLKDYRNLILFIAGICSFSMFFFVVTAIYYIVFKRKYFASFLLFIVVATILYVGRDIDIVRSLVFERFEIYSSGGGRTTDIFNSIYSEFITSPDVLWGAGMEKTSELLAATGSSSYKSIIYGYGIIGFALVIFFWIYYSYSSLKGDYRSLLIFCFIFFAVFYQRPALFEPYYCFLYVAILAKLSTYGKTFNNNNSCYL